MTTTSDGSRESVDTTILGDIQLPSHTVNRNRPSDAPQTKCFYCTQDRQKCDWEEGRRCSRCERLNYPCALENVPAAVENPRRTLRYEKCSFCRQSRQKVSISRRVPVNPLAESHIYERVHSVFPLTAYGPQGAIDVYLEILSAPNLRPRTPKVVNARLVNLQSQQSNPDPMPNGQGLMHLHHSKGKAPPSYK
ncbi:hypothetical protein Vi05172_g11501 [Venturia inaequalis]|nr:hypothetical protein Vi05172_g11501 [Venturia inaequalis]